MFFATTPQPAHAKKEAIPVCPKCKKEGKTVNPVTIKSQVLKEKKESMTNDMDAFCFCTSPECDVIYYSKDGHEIFYETDIKSKVTIKNDDPSTPLCYCHKYKKADAMEDMKVLEPKALVKKIRAMIDGEKFCQKANPKGSCCTADIKSWLAERNIPWETGVKLSPVGTGKPFSV